MSTGWCPSSGAGVEKPIKRRDGVVRVAVNFLNGTATIVYDETRIALDDIKRFIADCGYYCRGDAKSMKTSKKEQ